MRNPETGRSTAARHPTRRTQMKKSSLDFSEVGRCGAKTRSGNKWKWKQMSCSRDAKCARLSGDHEPWGLAALNGVSTARPSGDPLTWKGHLSKLLMGRKWQVTELMELVQLRVAEFLASISIDSIFRQY